jgi:hypothetical protein
LAQALFGIELKLCKHGFRGESGRTKSPHAKRSSTARTHTSQNPEAPSSKKRSRKKGKSYCLAPEMKLVFFSLLFLLFSFFVFVFTV